MARRITLPQLKKYDDTQKVLEMLADAESRAIIYSIIGSSLSFFFVKYFFIAFNSYLGLNIKMDDYLWLWIIGFSIFIGLYSSNQSMKRNLNE